MTEKEISLEAALAAIETWRIQNESLKAEVRRLGQRAEENLAVAERNADDLRRLRVAGKALLDQWDGVSREMNPVKLWNNLRSALASCQMKEETP